MLREGGTIRSFDLLPLFEGEAFFDRREGNRVVIGDERAGEDEILGWLCFAGVALVRGMTAFVDAATAAFGNLFTLGGTLVTGGALKQEQGGENLPGEGVTGGDENAFSAQLEATLFNKLFEGGIAIDMQMPIQLVVYAPQMPGIEQITVEALTFPEREGGEFGVEGIDKLGKIIPAEIAGQFEEDGFKKQARRGAGFAALVGAELIEFLPKGKKSRFDEAPLLIGKEGVRQAQIRVEII